MHIVAPLFFMVNYSLFTAKQILEEITYLSEELKYAVPYLWKCRWSILYLINGIEPAQQTILQLIYIEILKCSAEVKKLKLLVVRKRYVQACGYCIYLGEDLFIGHTLDIAEYLLQLVNQASCVLASDEICELCGRNELFSSGFL